MLEVTLLKTKHNLLNLPNILQSIITIVSRQATESYYSKANGNTQESVDNHKKIEGTKLDLVSSSFRR